MTTRGDGEAIEKRLSSVTKDVVRLQRFVVAARRVLPRCDDNDNDSNGNDNINSDNGDNSDNSDNKTSLLCRQLPRWLESLARGCKTNAEEQGKGMMMMATERSCVPYARKTTSRKMRPG